MERDTPLPSPESDKNDDKSTRKKRVYLPRVALGEQELQRRAADQMEASRNAENEQADEKKKFGRKKKKKPTDTVATAPEIEDAPITAESADEEDETDENLNSTDTTEVPTELPTVIRKASRKKKHPKSTPPERTEDDTETTPAEFTGELPEPVMPDDSEKTTTDTDKVEEAGDSEVSQTSNEKLVPEASTGPEEAAVDEAAEDDEDEAKEDPQSTVPSLPRPNVAPLPATPNQLAPAAANTQTGSALPPAPPVPPPVFGPGMPLNPNYMPAAATHGTLPTPVAEAPAAKKAAETQGEPRGSLLTGLIVGAVIEHIRHKGKEKRQEKSHAAVLSEYRKDRDAARTLQHAAEQKTNEASAKTTEHTPADNPVETNVPPVLSAPEKTPTPATAVIESSQQPEALRELQDAQAKAVETHEARQARAKIEQAIRDANTEPDPEEQPEIPKDRRVEQSAWHRIEVDKHTGKAVENPTVAYGEEFQKETHQEQLRRQIEEASMNSDLIRESYIVPKLGQSPLTPSSGQSTTTKSEAVRKSPTNSSPTAAPFVESKAIDVVLWIMLAVIIFAIVSLI